jgi:acyl-CoA synthetase (AMP-forming)/AMP-acid ligase II
MSPWGNIAPIVEVQNGSRLDPVQLVARALLKAEALRQHGLNSTHRIVLAHGNTAEFFCDLLAAWMLRASVVPLHPSATSRELAHVVGLTAASLVLTATERQGSDGIRVLHTVSDFAGATRALEYPQWPSDQDECLVLFSSGSSGRPKGVRHTWGGIRYRVTEIQKQLRSDSWQNTLCLLPTSFGHGLIGNCLAPWFAGKTLFLLPGFQPLAAGELPRILRENEIHFFSSVPSIWKVLEKCGPSGPLPALRRVHCASAPLSRSMRKFIQEWSGGAQVVNVYGITETASWIAGSPGAPGSEPDGYIGEPWGVDFRVLSGSRLHRDPGVTGELCLKTPSLLAGYLGGAEVPNAEGYFRTGDLGFLDERGHVVLAGRVSEFINRGGLKISPHEVRQCIEEHAAVAEAWVTGVDHEVWGQVVAVAVVPLEIDKFPLAEVRRWTEAQLSPGKHPSVWKVVAAIPKSPNGKVDREKIRELFSAS